VGRPRAFFALLTGFTIGIPYLLPAGLLAVAASLSSARTAEETRQQTA
jgi:hypothetical protein